MVSLFIPDFRPRSEMMLLFRDVADRNAMDAHLTILTRYGCNQRSEVLLPRLLEDMKSLARRPGELDDWFKSIDDRVFFPAVDTVDLIRNNLRSRRTSSPTVNALIKMFFLLAEHPSMHQYTHDLVDKADCPVGWLMKALQRDLCARAGEDNGSRDEVVAIALVGLQWVAFSAPVHTTLTFAQPLV